MSNDGSIPRLIEKLRRLVGRRNDEALRESLEELLVQRTEEAGEGEEPPPPLDPQERLLISNVLRLRGTTADDVMVPRTDIVAAPATLNLDELTRLFQREGHSRVPIFRETLDSGASYQTLDLGLGEGDNTPVFNVPEKHYFMMGDNRDNSSDSRFPDAVGYVPEENLVGRASFIIFSLGNETPFFQVWKWPTNLRYDRFFKGIK